MKIQKMLVLNQIPGKWERIDLENITKIGSFDELKFANDLHRIRFV